MIVVFAAACGAPPAPRAQGSSSAGESAPPATAEERAPDPARAPRADEPAILAAHNRFRADHCAEPLAWSDELAAESRRWVETLDARGCAFEHNPTTAHGENLAFFGPPGLLDGKGVAAMWYEELERYDFRHPGFSFEAGHFTQLVWVDTRQLGCASTECGNGELWVCNYSPAGNVEGEFERNVLPTSCK